MPDPTWPSSPPEVNYLRLVGPGAAGTASTMASAAAWQALSGGNQAALSASMLNTVATALDFEGVGGTSSTAAVTDLNASLQLLAGWAQEKPPIAASAVWAYETAVSSMIPAEVSVANRVEQSSAVAVNPLVLGALTPVIVALDTEYFGEHWPHNASAGAVYGAALAALVVALAVPPPVPPATTSAAAPATAAAAVAQSAGQAAAGEAMRESGQAARLAGGGANGPAEMAGQAGSMMLQPIQAATGAMQPAFGMFQSPMQAFGGLAALPQSMLGSGGVGPGGVSAFGTAVPPAMLATATGGGLGAGAGAGPVGAAGAGGSGGGVGGGIPGAGLTSFSRPSSSFAPENNGGRPLGLKTGLLGAAEVKVAGPSGASPGVSPSAMPVPPAQAGMLAHSKPQDDQGPAVRARVLLSGPGSSDRFNS